jgi:hypothetical protein
MVNNEAGKVIFTCEPLQCPHQQRHYRVVVDIAPAAEGNQRVDHNSVGPERLNDRLEVSEPSLVEDRVTLLSPQKRSPLHSPIIRPGDQQTAEVLLSDAVSKTEGVGVP